MKIPHLNLPGYRMKLSRRLSKMQDAAKKAVRKMSGSSATRAVHLRNDAYMICCPARSGSTMLVHLLRSHPQILSHGEVLGDKVAGLAGPLGHLARQDPAVHERVEDWRQRNPLFFLYNYILDAHGQRAVGFKLKYDELVLPAYRDLMECVRDDVDLKIIFLDRENLLERYVSHHVAMHVTGVTLLTDSSKKPEVRPMRLDCQDMERNFTEQLARQDKFRELFKAHRCIETTYERLTRDARGEMRAIYEFLGVDRHDPSTATRKILDSDMRSLVSNYAEVAAHFEGTRFEPYFHKTA